MCNCKDKIEKTISIVKAVGTQVISKIFNLNNKNEELSNQRIIECIKCDDITYLYKTEFIGYLTSNGIDILKNLNDLSKLPKLEKKEFGENKEPFCSICKCWLPAKTSVKNEKCPLNKW